jgi:peptidoglycan LD-endopeptidase LytH
VGPHPNRRPPGRRPARLVSSALLAALLIVPVLASSARGLQDIDELKSRLDRLQEELDNSTNRVEELRAKENELRFAVGRVAEEIRDLERQKDRLQARAMAAARRLYMSNSSETLDILLSSESFAEIASRSQALAHVSEMDASTLTDFNDAETRLIGLQSDLIEKADALTVTRARLEAESEELQAQFDAVTDEYIELKKKLAAAAQRRARAIAGGFVYVTAAGMTCPVAAPNSFIDSWHFPRDGGARLHEGADMFGEEGAPLVAVTNGRITYAGVGVTAGNYLKLTGDDGHEYWYLHNEKNIVTSGRVRVGELIAVLGDTGNAQGTSPHLHFEYHPSGGEPVNPYPLLVQICQKA